MTTNETGTMQTDDASVTIHRVFPTTPERLFDAWTDPDRVRQWLAPGPMTCSVPVYEARKGGRFRIEMTGPGAEARRMAYEGTFDEVRRGERIVMLWPPAMPSADGRGADPPSVVAVTFTPVAGGTRLRLTQDGMPHREARTKVYAALKDLADAGWVVAHGGRPVHYSAVAPEARIQLAQKALLEETATAMRELQARRTLAQDMVPVSLYLLRGRENVLRKSHEVLARARHELFVNLGFLYEGEADGIVEAVAAARRRGVVVRLLLGPGLAETPAFAPLLAEARLAIFPFRGIVADARQALIAFPAIDREPAAFWNPTQAFLDMVAPFLRATWARAPPARP